MLVPLALVLPILFFCIGKVAPSLTTEIENTEKVLSHCFEHVTTQSSSTYLAGDVLQVCMKLPALGDTRDSDVDAGVGLEAVVVRVGDETSIKKASEFNKNVKQLSSQPRLLQTVNTSAHMIIYVDDTVDGVANTSPCQPSSPSAGCNLRSALLLCSESLTWPDRNCTIILPSEETIVLDSSLGELVVIDAKGTLRIEGEGCLVTSLTGNNYIRFLNISFGSTTAVSSSPSDSTSISEFVFHLSNITLEGFGESSLKGGSIYLESLAGGSIEDITCSSSRGSYGGAVFLDRSQEFQISRSHFVNNTAAGIYIFSFLLRINVEMTNNAIKIMFCLIL